MYDDIYEVSRDEYVGFLGQIKKSCRSVETKHIGDERIEVITSSIDKERIFAKQVIIKDEEEPKYYVYDMPLDHERQQPPAVRKVVLETKEDIQRFLDFLGKLGGNKND